MNVVGDELKHKVERLMAEGYMIWETSKLPSLPDSERHIASDAALRVYHGENAEHFAAACQSFYLFRKLHGMIDEYPIYGVLLGDYFFSLFSKNLIPLDSVRLNNEFARFLSKDTQTPVSADSYFRFISRLPVVMRS